MANYLITDGTDGKYRHLSLSRELTEWPFGIEVLISLPYGDGKTSIAEAMGKIEKIKEGWEKKEISRKETRIMTFLPHLYRCNNCDGELTEENIRLALEDAGEIPNEISSLSRGEQNHYTLCCPTFDGNACQGYCSEDRDKPAYWSYS